MTEPSAAPVAPGEHRSLRGRRVVVEPFHDRHVGAVHRLAHEDGVQGRWPLWGHPLSAAELRDALWAGADLQHVVIDVQEGGVVGLLQAIDIDHWNGTCSLNVLLGQEAWRTGWALEGAVLFLGHLFDDLRMRKVYFHAPDYVMPHLRSSVGRWLVLEGRLTRHVYAMGRYHDQVTLSISAARWTELTPVLGR